MQTRADQLTTLIRSSADGSAAALNELLQEIYQDLKIIARARRRGDPHSGDLHTTALVHEAILRILDSDLESIQNTKHLLALASRIMRHILIDFARKHQNSKRVGEAHPDVEKKLFIIDRHFDVELLDLDRAIRSMAQDFPRRERVVECRFFGGMTNEETAEALDVSARTVKRDWLRAKAYLLEDLRVSV